MRIIFSLFFVKFTSLGAVFHLFETKFLGANRKSFLASQDAKLQVSNIINFAEINCKDLPLMVWANQYCQHVKIKYLKIMEISKEKGKIGSNLFNASYKDSNADRRVDWSQSISTLYMLFEEILRSILIA